METASDRVSHGQHSALIRLDNAHRQISSAALASNWNGYDRLLFDLYTDLTEVSTATSRIYDAADDVSPSSPDDHYFDGRNKIFLQQGCTHVEVKLTPLKAGSFERDIALDRIRRFELSFDEVRLPATIHIDNIGLVSGPEAYSILIVAAGYSFGHRQPLGECARLRAPRTFRKLSMLRRSAGMPSAEQNC
jgi:hypothetical protein